LFILTLSLFFPCAISLENEGALAILAVATPFVGFLVHQIYRYFFEITGGYSRPSRKAITYIEKVLAPEIGVSITCHEAFLIWELTIYGSKTTTSFLSHDATYWHFILSFWSISFACLLGFALSIVLVYINGISFIPYLLCGYVTLGLFFYHKGYGNYQSLNSQEEAYVQCNKDAFICVMKQLVNGGVF